MIKTLQPLGDDFLLELDQVMIRHLDLEGELNEQVDVVPIGSGYLIRKADPAQTISTEASE